MIVAFETKTLREMCEDGDVAAKKLGAAVAEALRQRLADVRAAESIEDLIVGNPRTSGSNGSILTIGLTQATQSVWEQNHPTARLRPDGYVDWTRTTRIRVTEIAGLQ